MLFGMIKEVAGKHSQEQLAKFADALTEGQIQFIVDRYMVHANGYSAKHQADKSGPLAEFFSNMCFEWTKEASRWAGLPAGLTD